MASRIWEIVAANRIQVGDVLAWHYQPHTDGVTDAAARVRVTEVAERELESEPLPAINLWVEGPQVAFERMSGVRTSRMYRQGDPVMRMKPDHAARVGANLRSVVRPVEFGSAGFSSAQRLEAARAGRYPAGMEPGDL
jgi:hypothetical protein